MADVPAIDAPPWRLRDLDRRGRLVAAATVILLLVPVGTSVARALAADWVPSGDDALIVLRAFDVFSADPPLVGQPSTAEAYAPGVAARHPGPIEFYALAVPVRVLGPALGTLLTIAAVTSSSVLIAAWVAFRRGGPAVGLGAAVLLGLVMWTTGTSLLTDPISSNMGTYPLLAGAALAWALWCDDRRLWPLAAAVWSFTIQQHLAIFGVAGLLAAWGVAGAVATTLRRRHEPGRIRSALRWGPAATVVAVVCWLPPLLDQLAGTGNLAKIGRFSGDGGRESLGLDYSMRVVARAVAVPPLLLDPDRELAHQVFGGWAMAVRADAADWVWGGVGGAVMLLATTVTVRAARRPPVPARDPDAGARLALFATSAVLLVAGTLTAAQIPNSVESLRINFYRWVWAFALTAWGAVAWTVGRALAPRLARLREQRPALPLAPAGVAVALVALLVPAVVAAADPAEGDIRRDEALFPYDRRAGEAAADAVPAGRPVRLLTTGGAAYLAVGPAVAVILEDAGHEVHVDGYQAPGYGEHRTRPAEPGEVVVHVISAKGPAPEHPGTVVAEENLPLEPGGRTDVWGDDTFVVRVEVG